LAQEIITNEFEKYIVSEIKDFERSIVYPDGEDIRLTQAIKIFQNFNKSKTILLGRKDIISKNIKESEIKDTDTIEIIEPSKSAKLDEYKNLLINIFKDKGKELTEQEAESISKQNNYFAALMVKSKDAHCGISGSFSSTEAMMKPLIQVIQAGEKKRYLNGAVIEIIPDCPYGLNGQFLLADIAVIPDPNEEQMLDIVLLSYETAKALFNGEPKIAMLSYSTKGSAQSEKINQINRVIEKVKNTVPGIKIDGEFQIDAALFPDVAKSKCPDSEIAGKANVLIFPELNSANMVLKVIHRLAKANYYGTTIQGAAVPFNDVSRGCFPIDLVWITGMTLMQRKRMEEKQN
jgi:phosphate acetyltransferase